jgi:hypothetical protein
MVANIGDGFHTVTLRTYALGLTPPSPLSQPVTLVGTPPPPPSPLERDIIIERPLLDF